MMKTRPVLVIVTLVTATFLTTLTTSALAAHPASRCQVASRFVLAHSSAAVVFTKPGRSGSSMVTGCLKDSGRRTVMGRLGGRPGAMDDAPVATLGGSVAAVELRRDDTSQEGASCRTEIVVANLATGTRRGPFAAADACAGVERLRALPAGGAAWTSTDHPRQWGGSGALSLHMAGSSGGSVVLDAGPVLPGSLTAVDAHTISWGTTAGVRRVSIPARTH